MYVYCGSEQKVDWMRVLGDLVERWLKKVLIVVSDDFTGLREVIKSVYPLADHQLCTVHLKRNIDKNMEKEDAKEFKRMISSLKNMEYEEALEKF